MNLEGYIYKIYKLMDIDINLRFFGENQTCLMYRNNGRMTTTQCGYTNLVETLSCLFFLLVKNIKDEIQLVDDHVDTTRTTSGTYFMNPIVRFRGQ